jgi:hypothetical protein
MADSTDTRQKRRGLKISEFPRFKALKILSHQITGITGSNPVIFGSLSLYIGMVETWQ